MTLKKFISQPQISILLKKRNYEDYLLSLYNPKTIRHDIQHILFFNLELSKIPVVTNDVITAFSRLGWWHNHITEVYKELNSSDLKNNQHLIYNEDNLTQLRNIICNYNIDQNYFLEHIDARKKDLDDSVFNTHDDIIAYIKHTRGNILRSIAHIILYQSSQKKDLIILQHESELCELLDIIAICIKYHHMIRSLTSNKLVGHKFIDQESYNKLIKPQKDKDQRAYYIEYLCQSSLDLFNQIPKKYFQKHKLMYFHMLISYHQYYIKQLAKHHYDINSYDPKTAKSKLHLHLLYKYITA